jgi:hypothetical protein
MYRQSVDGALSIFTSPPFFHKYRAMFVHAHLYLATNGYSGAPRYFMAKFIVHSTPLQPKFTVMETRVPGTLVQKPVSTTKARWSR